MKKLAQKNLSYSILLAAVMLLFLVGYFILMLPSLYVDHVNEENLAAVKKQHQAFMETGTYEGIQVKNPTACISVRVPLDADYIEAASKLASIKITVTDTRIKEILADIRTFIRSQRTHKTGVKPAEYEEWFEKKLPLWQKKWKTAYKGMGNGEQPVDIEIIRSQDPGTEYHGEHFTVHAVSEDRMILEASVSDTNNQYTNYIAVEQTADAMVLSLLPVVTPQMDEIRPIVIQSLPMLGAVILMLVLLFSQIYSRGIVSPILMLVRHTEAMKADREFTVQPLGDMWQGRAGEVEELAVTIDALYQQIKDSYQKLQAANLALQEENERQEVFLRASSHQLKTPVTAALLLTDGMIQQVGKYRDTTTYLPKVKEQLLSMRKIIEDILSLGYGKNGKDSGHCCEIRLQEMIRGLLGPYRALIAQKQLEVVQAGEETARYYGDEDMLAKILDNLLSNAMEHTSSGATVYIFADSHKVSIRNEGAAVPEDLLPHIFEPFVKGGQGEGSHGLGLYIASYYAGLLGTELSVRNVENGVEAVLKLYKTSTPSSYGLHRERL